jgi:excisionase family DNA binding protein
MFDKTRKTWGGPDAPPLTQARLAPEGSLAARLDGEDEPSVVRTLADLRADPERLVDAADIARIGLAGSYAALRRWVISGALPNPYRLSGRRLAWRAGDVLKASAPVPDTPGTVLAAQDEKLVPLALTINDAARFSGLSRSTVYQALARGDIKGVRAGRRTLVLTESLHAFIETRPPYCPTVGPRATREPRSRLGPEGPRHDGSP